MSVKDEYQSLLRAIKASNYEFNYEFERNGSRVRWLTNHILAVLHLLEAPVVSAVIDQREVEENGAQNVAIELLLFTDDSVVVIRGSGGETDPEASIKFIALSRLKSVDFRQIRAGLDGWLAEDVFLDFGDGDELRMSIPHRPAESLMPVSPHEQVVHLIQRLK